MFKIKALSQKYPGRIIYIPGNHDSFAYEYAANQSMRAKMNMEGNHGYQKVKDIDNLRRNNPEKLYDLMNWPGNLLYKENTIKMDKDIF